MTGRTTACNGWVTGEGALGEEMARVYLSSTLADLRRERQAVMEWLVAAGHQPVDSYLPGSDTVRDSCLDDVDKSDLYVLIAGYRYGFQPPQDNPDGLSITHLEFRRAGQSGKPRTPDRQRQHNREKHDRRLLSPSCSHPGCRDRRQPGACHPERKWGWAHHGGRAYALIATGWFRSCARR